MDVVVVIRVGQGSDVQRVVRVDRCVWTVGVVDVACYMREAKLVGGTPRKEEVRVVEVLEHVDGTAVIENNVIGGRKSCWADVGQEVG